MLPPEAPSEYANRQTLWREADRAEIRSDSRTALRAIGSLPNELTLDENIELVREYLTENFVSEGRCADYAIHEIRNAADPTRDNIHFHLLLADRPLLQESFAPIKNRDWNKKAALRLWRKRWAEAQNRAYERKGLDVRVTDRSYIGRGIFKREPKKYLQRGDMYLERSGVQTARGDENREIEARNQSRELKRQKKREKERNQSRSR
jgi:ATP-dependent exoDNAse (exonuclease V) alpha subunit